MAEIINLRIARKRKARADAAADAAEARARHGRTKAERTLEQARAGKAERDVEAHRRERPVATLPGDGAAGTPGDPRDGPRTDDPRAG